jgi:quercetin dioxygenase-like cupin family protein
MAIPHAAPGIPTDLCVEGDSLSQAKTNALVKTDAFEAIRMVIPAGHEVCRNHQVEGPITVQCLAGQIALTVGDDVHVVRPGHWVFLPGGVPHTIAGVEDSLALLTVIFRP